MMNFTDILVMVGMFALRIGVPVAIMAGMVYLLKRLDRRWEIEARAEQSKRAAQEAVRQPVLPQPAERPGRAEQPAPSRRVPAPAPLPFIPPPAQPTAEQPGLSMAAVAQPCWDVWKCTEETRAKCAAGQHPEKPCWQARFEAEGQVPSECVQCKIFERYPLM